MRALTTAIAFSACAMSFGQSHFRFIVTGDDRWETKGARAGMDENGVNVAAMKTLVKAMLAEKRRSSSLTATSSAAPRSTKPKPRSFRLLWGP